MPYEITRVTTFMYMQRYIEFVLDSYKRLNMPYPFTVALGYLASPVLMREEMFLAFDDEHRVVGCLSFIRGTAEADYQNREIVQLQVIYIEESYRSSTMLLGFLKMLVQYLNYKEEPVKELQFWTKDDAKLRQLVTKRLAIQPHSQQTVFGQLDFYTLPFPLLEEYISNFPQEQYF